MIVIALIALLIVYLLLRSQIDNKFKEIELMMTWMKQDVKDIKQKMDSIQHVTSTKDSDQVIHPVTTPEDETINARWMPPGFVSVEPSNELEAPQGVQPDEIAVPLMATPEPFVAEMQEPASIVTDDEDGFPTSPITEYPTPNPFAVPPTSSTWQPAEKKPSFWEKNPDFEKFVGENLINKIGIAILVLGIGFFVKYAIDQDWINEIGRVFIGILCGGALIALAHKMRKTFIAFSSVLIGGGLSVLYFTIGLAFMQYQLLSQEAAFGIMVVITSFAVALSLLYNRIELAVIALVGGFGTPFFVSTGEGNYVVLFTYLIILNSGMLVLALRKKWNLVNLLSYIFTVIIYGAWLTSDMLSEHPHYSGALIFGTIYYFMFWLMNVAYNIKYKQKFEAQEFTLLISNTFLYYLAGMLILRHIDDGLYQGLFTAAMGIINFVFAFVMHRKRAFDRNLFYLLIGLVLTFISLAAPIQLKGNHITLFWAAEAVLLLWLSQKSGIRIIKIASMVIGGLMIISLIMDWQQIYGSEEWMPIAFNRGFMTGIGAAVALFLYNLLLRGETRESFFDNELSLKVLKQGIAITTVALLYFGGLLELTHQLERVVANYPDSFDEGRRVIICGYHFVFVACLALLHQRSKLQSIGIALIVATGILCLMYLMLYNPAVIDTREQYLNGYRPCSITFGLHFIFSVIFLYLLYVLKRRLTDSFETTQQTSNYSLWIVIPVFVYWLSAELDHMVVMMAQNPDGSDYIIEQTHKFGYPILWGVTSFVMVVLGLRNKNKQLRVIGLSLFSLIVLKLFLFDVWGMNEGGKILAFVLLGVLLLVVSFMYQRLKKILSNDEEINHQA
jgi:uncharacterized membrane protein